MSRTKRSEPSALKELQRVARLLNDEVIPRLHAGEPSGNGAAAPPAAGGGPDPELPDAPSGRQPSAAVLEALEQAYRQMSPESASALSAVFSQVDGNGGEQPEPGEPGEEEPGDTGEDDARPPGSASRGLATRAAARGIKFQPGARVGQVGKLLLRILEHYPKRGELAISSGYRPEGGSHHGGLVYKGSPTAAIDIVAPGAAKMRDVAQWLYRNFAGDTVELIHTTPFNTDQGFYVKNQVKYPGGGIYGAQLRREHRNHVHFACSKALAQKILGRLKPREALRAVAAAPVWGWDASGHDWRRGPVDVAAAKRAGISFFTHKCSEGHTFQVAEYKKALERARAARMPVMGAYHVLWPGNPIQDARFFFKLVNAKTPWWKTVPWIWQLDAEKFKGMPRPPSPGEARKFLDELKRLAGGRGYFIAYAPRWVYGDSFKIGYDLWASDYNGSGAPRPFAVQYKGVPQKSWRPYSGRKPRILQFASDATIGRQKTCDANRFDGSLKQLIALTNHRRAARAGRSFELTGAPGVPLAPEAAESAVLARHG